MPSTLFLYSPVIMLDSYRFGLGIIAMLVAIICQGGSFLLHNIAQRQLVANPSLFHLAGAGGFLMGSTMADDELSCITVHRKMNAQLSVSIARLALDVG